MKTTRMSALIAGALLALALPTVAEAKKAPKLTVMTRNVLPGRRSRPRHQRAEHPVRDRRRRPDLERDAEHEVPRAGEAARA